MSINNGAVIIVGIPYADIDGDDIDYVDQLIYDDELQLTSVYYDSCNDRNVVGVVAFSTDDFNMIENYEDEISAARVKFVSLLERYVPAVYLALDIT